MSEFQKQGGRVVYYIPGSRAYFNVQLMTISAVVKCNLQLQKVNCAVVVVSLEV